MSIINYMENDRNICTFIQSEHSYGNLQILHVILETKQQIFDGWKTNAYYRVHYVSSGRGVLHTQYGDYMLKDGDIFLSLPSTPYAIQSIKDFKYIYVSCIGEKANRVFDVYKFNIHNCVFSNYKLVKPLWENIIKFPSGVIDTFAEGLVLCTLSEITSTRQEVNLDEQKPKIQSLIKKYIDENFSNADLSLNVICKVFSYNDKYLSKIFKEEFKTSFKEYLITIRINNACALFGKGFTCVKDVANMCGFNDSLYFSKVFKNKMKVSPREYINDHS